jgi:uncharacterized membrane protein
MVRLAALRDAIRESLWFIPAVFALAAAIAAFALVATDRALSADAFYAFAGSPEGARSVLSTISTSMLTFTALVFSITMLVLQLASSQLSPRVMRTFLRDRSNQVVLGLFIATFLYTLLVLREVRSPAEGDPFVPGLSVWVAVVLAVASVAAFIHYIHHMAHAIQSSTVIHNVARATRGSLETLYPDGIGEDGARRTTSGAADLARTISADRPGTLRLVDGVALLEAAARADVVAELLPAIGDFVPEGSALFRVHGAGRSDAEWDALEREIQGSVTIGAGRSMAQDATFGFRQLVDIAARALSPGINDPTTAVEAINELHDLLRRLGQKPFPRRERADQDGRLRLVLSRPDFADYVGLALAELRIYGSGHLQIARRLRFLLDDVARSCRAEHRAVLLAESDRLERMVERGFDDPDDRDLARIASGTGQGMATRAGPRRAAGRPSG